MIKAITQRFLCALVLCMPASLYAQEEGIAEAVADAAPSAAKNETAKPSARPITVAVSLVDDNTVLTGTLSDTTSMSIKTAFGLAELPLSEVAGVRFPRNDDTSTTVVMLNGDSITGATDLKFAQIETTWGSAKINGQSIASILMVPGLTWQSSDVLGSKRWQLIEAPRNQSGAQSGIPGNPNANPGAARPGTAGPQANRPVQPSAQIIRN